MKKILFSLLSLGLTAATAWAQDAPATKWSPTTKSYFKKIENKQHEPVGYVYKNRVDGKRCISAIAKVNPAFTGTLSAQLQIHATAVGSKAGNIWTLQIPLEQVRSVASLTGIEYFEIDVPIQPLLSTARKTTRVDSVHAGISLPKGYSGKDVIMGIIDFGFDYNHPSMYDTSGNRYRIIKSWEMDATGTPPTGYSYGNELSDSFALKAKGTDNDVQTHGAGVAGLAAGSGFGGADASEYRGIAYESDMIFVGVRRDSIGDQWKSGGFSDFIDAANYLVDYASSVSKPIVINISWGSHSGPHDGTSLVNQAFDALSGPGKIIVMSAGNEGTNPLHLDKTFSSTDTSVKTFLYFSSNDYKRTWIDIWGDKGKDFCVRTSLFGNKVEGASTAKICLDNDVHYDTLIAANGIDTCYVETITSDSEYNGKPRTIINVFSKTSDSVCISVSGNDGSVNLWNEYYYYGYQYRYQSYFLKMGFAWATDGNTNTTISDMGAGFKTLLIGAYNSKVRFTDLKGIPRSYTGTVGRRSSFSSKGPYIDGRIKPDITAPGLTIATSVNSYDSKYIPGGSNETQLVAEYTDPASSRKYYFGEFTGTSASAPLASGIVALLLEIDPTLTPERIDVLLSESAIVDFSTGTIPPGGNNEYGAGKINAYGAVRALLKELSVEELIKGKTALDAVIFPNPASKSCTIDLNTTYNDKLNITIVDLFGKSILHKEWRVSIGNNQLPLELDNLPEQYYLVKIEGATQAVTLKLQVK